MADLIRVDTDLLEKCANELTTAAQGFGDAASILSGLNTSEEWWSKMGRLSPLKLQDEGSSMDLGDAGAAVRALTAVMRRYDSRATTLGKNVSKAAGLFSNTEKALLGRANGQDEGETTQFFGDGSASPVGADSGAQKEKKDSPWWEILKGAVIKVGTPWAVIMQTLDFLRKDNPTGYDWAKYILNAAKPVAKWAEWMHSHSDATATEKLLKTVFNASNVKTAVTWKEAFADKFSAGPTPVDVVFSAFTSGVDNFKEFKEGKISGDRAIVEWGAEFGLDVFKTVGIGAGGAALGTAALAAIGVTPVGWVAAGATVVGTAVVSGAYCGVNWLYKKFVSPNSNGLIQDAGHYVGEAYDAAKNYVGEKLDGLKKWASKKAKAAWSFAF